MDSKDLVKVVGVSGLTIICIVALVQGIDSVLLGGIAAIIGGIVGYQLKKETEARKVEM